MLLGYSSWRDAKTAILVFNRGTSTSTVLDGVRERTEAHQYWKRTVDWKHESGFRYVFHHPGDRNRSSLSRCSCSTFRRPPKLAN